ncbi:MAG TPA: STAS domain-containing protein [Solirubrobacteraceae bacterium]|nr:STAS domain-containing protein [Solirubrobacteraceae bacterium]
MNLGDVQFTRRAGMLVAELTGEIDLSNAESVGQAIAETTSNLDAGVVLDLSALRYLDSAGIQFMFRLREQLRTRGQSFALVIPAQSASNDALRLAGVTLHVETFETQRDALRSAAADRDDG